MEGRKEIRGEEKECGVRGGRRVDGLREEWMKKIRTKRGTSGND